MIRLNVPYVQKDEAKALGAKWNYTQKFWYCEDDEVDKFLRWYDDGDRTEAPTVSSEGERFLTVRDINELAENWFEENPVFDLVRVRGEIIDHSVWNGAHFFNIKDADPDISQTTRYQLRCVVWSNTASTALKDMTVEDGMEVGLVGRLQFNTRYGSAQLVVARLVDLGEGEDTRQLELLKAKLQAEGIFDPEHKKPIPRYPAKIGIVSSKDGDAIRDICRVAHDRNPYVQLFLYHVTVQGASAPSSIIDGIKQMDKRGYDLIIVSRGGGARGDLAAFDDEMVVRTVYNAKTPIVSGVGHENDWTLIDHVSDMRFATPTYAAQGVIPDVMTDIRRLESLRSSMKYSMEKILHTRRLLLSSKTERLERYNPEAVLREKKERLNTLVMRLDAAMRDAYLARVHRFELAVASLHGNSPTAKLVRGFGYLTKDEKPVLSVKDVAPGEEIVIRIHDGSIRTGVIETSENAKGI